MMRKFKQFLAVLSMLTLASVPAFASDRVIVYPLQNPTSTQQSLLQRYPRVAIGNLIRDMLGTSNAGGVYTNMTISPASGLFVTVGPTTANNDGTLYQLGVDDVNPVPVNITPQLAADPTVIMLQGILSAPSSQIGPITVPDTAGQSQYTLIEAQLQTVDTTPQRQLFVNQAGGKYYQTVNANRTDAIVFQTKAGTAGTSPTPPAVDSGWVSIGTILVPYGTSTITSGMIAASPPFAGFTASSGTITSVTASAPLASSGGTTPNITLSTPVGVAYGGTGSSTLSSNAVLLGNGTSALQTVAPGASGNVLISNGTTWTSAPGGSSGVSSFSAGSTGLTPSSSTTGAITLAGTLGTGSGGTGLAVFTSGKALYATSTSALTTGTLPTTAGGTGMAAFTSGGAVYATSTSALTTGTLPVTAGGTGATTLTGYLVGNGTSAVTASSTIPTSAIAGTLGTANGGTGMAAFTSGGAVYATSTSALTTGTLPTTAGGTGMAAFTSGGAVYATSTSALTTGTLPVTAGGTGATTLTGYLIGNGTSGVTASSTIPTSAITGTIGTTAGGTGMAAFTSGGAVYATSTSALTTGTLPVTAGGTGVTASTGSTSVVLRDANANIAANNVALNTALTTSAGGTNALSAASAGYQVLTGTATQTYTLPNATTLSAGASYQFNNASTGSLTINNNGGSGISTVPGGGDEIAILTDNSTANGTWDVHGFSPSGSTWGSGGLNTNNVTLTGTLTPGRAGTAGTSSIYSGTGTPAFSAPAGSLFLSYSGTGGALAYYNSSTAGTSGTSWTAIGTGGGGAGGAVYPDPAASPFPQGCQYNTTLPTVTSGATAQVQCDQNARTLINAVVSVASPLPVQAASVARTATNGSITTGGTAQNWAAAGAITHGCMLQNTSSLPEYLRFDGTAASASSLMVLSGGYYECPITGLPTAAASIFGATTGQTFYSEVW